MIFSFLFSERNKARFAYSESGVTHLPRPAYQNQAKARFCIPDGTFLMYTATAPHFRFSGTQLDRQAINFLLEDGFFPELY